MNISAPIGDARYAPFFIRVTLGAYFAYAGYIKVQDVPFFIEELKQFSFIPEHLATLVGILLPYVEIAIGGMLILGLWTTLSGILACVLLASFIYAYGIFPRPQIPNKDFILFAAALSLLYSGAGALSLDSFRKGGGD
jgi:uncharacterized membrane protein YphA (DoxX/SURF4 family)